MISEPSEIVGNSEEHLCDFSCFVTMNHYYSYGKGGLSFSKIHVGGGSKEKRLRITDLTDQRVDEGWLFYDSQSQSVF